MERVNIFKVALSYIKQNLKGIFIFCLFSFIFAFIFKLYNIQAYAVGYAVVLCAFLLVIYLIVDFTIYYKRHKKLIELKNKISISIDELPSPDNLIEQDYSDLLEVLYNDKTKYINEAENKKSNLIEYYTLWAHQIKTPISAMRLLLQSYDNEESKELTSELFKIEQYVEMVLSYLRINSDYTDFVLNNYSIESIVKQAVRKYAHLFVLKKISIDLHSLDCEVLTDEKWLLFVIEQVLSNALKYTNKGKISIYMYENKTLVIEDTGIGISKEDLPRICQKGYTGYNGRTDKKATGIGLYLCKRISTKLSHTINIQSEVGKGTKVLIGLDTIKVNLN